MNARANPNAGHVRRFVITSGARDLTFVPGGIAAPREEGRPLVGLKPPCDGKQLSGHNSFWNSPGLAQRLRDQRLLLCANDVRMMWNYGLHTKLHSARAASLNFFECIIASVYAGCDCISSVSPQKL